MYTYLAFAFIINIRIHSICWPYHFQGIQIHNKHHHFRVDFNYNMCIYQALTTTAVLPLKEILFCLLLLRLALFRIAYQSVVTCTYIILMMTI